MEPGLLEPLLAIYPANLRAGIANNLRYIDWNGASPRTLTSPDLPALLATDRLWARKVDIRQAWPCPTR